MIKIKRKLLLLTSVVVILFVIILISTEPLSGRYYRTKLPDIPNLTSAAKSLKKQIYSANLIAYFVSTSKNLGELGMVYHANAFYNEAIECYNLALLRNPDKWIWSYYLGYLNLELGESKTAISNFNYVIHKNPDNYLAWYYGGIAFQSLGNLNYAEKYFEEIVNIDELHFDVRASNITYFFPLKTYAMLGLSRIYLSTGRLDKAEVTLKKIIQAQVEFGPAYRMLGNLYFQKGEEGLSDYYVIRANDLLDFMPPADLLANKLTLLSRSELYLLKQIDMAIRSFNFEWAVTLCDHAMSYIPDNKYLLSKAIKGYLSMGYESRALPLLDSHIEKYNDDYVELVELANLLHDKRYKSAAYKYFSLANQIDPLNPNNPIWLGERGYHDEAVKLLYEQLETDPENIYFILYSSHTYPSIVMSPNACEVLILVQHIHGFHLARAQALQ